MSLDQELSKEKAPEHSSGAEESERTNGSKGSLQPEAEGSPAPEAAGVASFERSVTRCPTVSSRGVDISLKVGFGQEGYANNALLLNLVLSEFSL
jgi:hypothetical protein